MTDKVRKTHKTHTKALTHGPVADGSPNRDCRRTPSTRRDEPSPIRNSLALRAPLDGDFRMHDSGSPDSSDSELLPDNPSRDLFQTQTNTDPSSQMMHPAQETPIPHPTPHTVNHLAAPSAPPTGQLSAARRDDAIEAARASINFDDDGDSPFVVRPHAIDRPNALLPSANHAAERLERMKTANIMVNTGHFPRHIRDPVFSHFSFNKEQLEAIGISPNHWVEICVFNGGDHLSQHVPNVSQEIKDIFKQVGVRVTRTIFPYLDTIAERKPRTDDEPKGPKLRGKGNGKEPKGPKTSTNLYGGPVHGAVEILDPNDLAYTIAQQTFGKSQTVAFHAREWVQDQRSHSVAELRCSDNEDTTDNRREIRTTLVDHFLHSNEFHRVIAENVAGNELTTTKVACCVQSMDVVPQPYKAHLRSIDWCSWILYMLPTANDKDLYTRAEKENRIRTFIRSHTKISRSWMSVYVDPIECTICKSDSHSTHGCPYIEMDTWSGPRLQVRDVVKNIISANVKTTTKTSRASTSTRAAKYPRTT